MKTMDKLLKKALFLCVVLLGLSARSFAQCDMSKMSLKVDWQMNAPLSTDFADKLSGWGMNYELAYSFTPRWEAGLFASFHTNHKYIGRQTLALSPTESLTTDQQRSAFQVPFGLTAAFNLSTNRYCKPYIGVKVGAMFARNTTYYAATGLYDDGWGFYVSPEIGLKIYPTGKHWGFHIAGYYSYATNQTQTLTVPIDGQSNVGFRLGVIF